MVSGELTPIPHVIEAQKAPTPVLWGPAYIGNIANLKLHTVLSRQPHVITLGTSRITQFRSAFFTPTVSFYNAGLVIQRIEHANHFLRRLPLGKEPRIIIIALDHNFLTPSGMMRQTKTWS